MIKSVLEEKLRGQSRKKSPIKKYTYDQEKPLNFNIRKAAPDHQKAPISKSGRTKKLDL